MFIQIQETPNPQTVKFNPGIKIIPKGTFTFNKGDDISSAPLAQALFTNADVVAVFISDEFISITKDANSDWEDLKPRLLTQMTDFFNSGIPAITINITNINEENTSEFIGDEGSQVVAEIRDLIETRVRPAVAQDGGDIVFKGFKDGIVYLELQGACSGCPSATITLKDGIENMLKHYIPEVVAVEAVN
jgi:Fe-S cluster biogenesis protein NfuA